MSVLGRAASRPGRVVLLGVLLGILVTSLFTWTTARTDRNTEERLLQTQTRQAALVLTTAVMGIEQSLRAVLDAQVLLPPDEFPEAFTELFSGQVGEDAAFASASLWQHGAEEDLELLETLGDDPGLDLDSPVLQELLRRAIGAETSVVQRVEVGDRTRIAYALADPETGLVIYAERPIPANRRAPVDRDSAFADIEYAIYLGDTTDDEDLTTTDVDPDSLPLTGLTSTTTVPFGDTVLTLVTRPRQHLGSPLSKHLPWVLLVAGLMLTAAVAAVARQLLKSQQQAVLAAAEISGLYERLDVAYAEQREVSVRLQRAVLPRVLPDLPGIEVAAEYVAGGDGIDIGGDWYSAIALTDETFGFVVGDVSGHGIDAVAEMARARFTLRAYLLDGADPETALTKCAKQFDITADGHMITALVGVGNRRTGQIRVSSAGHPAPLLLSDGGADFVDLTPGLPLGAGVGTYRSTTLTLAVGSTLIAFTDGLIERRGEAIDVGMRRLAETTETAAGQSLQAVVRTVLTSVEGQETDDVAVLALRRVKP